jgi:uncharacterized damage-inducible protein DinB
MSMAEFLVGEFDHEAGNTRKALARVPEAHVAWQPHPKSSSLGELALHIAGLPVWVGRSLQLSEFDLPAPGGPGPTRDTWKSHDALMAKFEKNTADARAIIAATTDAQFMEPWTLKRGGVAAMTLPKVAVLRSFVFNHTIHHRGQLTVYLRLKDVPLPFLYGPTADENM